MIVREIKDTPFQSWTFEKLRKFVSDASAVMQGNLRERHNRLDLVDDEEQGTETQGRVISFDDFLRNGASSPEGKLYAVNIPVPSQLKKEVPRYEHLFGDHWADGDFDPKSPHQKPDEEVLFVGRRGSRTAFHQDFPTVLALLPVAVGRKALILFPPQPPTDQLSEVAATAIKTILAPWKCISAKQLKSTAFVDAVNSVNGVVAILDAGDTLHIPPYWWHAAINLTDCVAISKGVVNGSNIELAYDDWKRDPNRLLREHRDFPKLIRALKKKMKKLSRDDCEKISMIEREMKRSKR